MTSAGDRAGKSWVAVEDRRECDSWHIFTHDNCHVMDVKNVDEHYDLPLALSAPELCDVLHCLSCAVVAEANGIPNDLKHQLERSSAVLARARGEVTG